MEKERISVDSDSILDIIAQRSHHTLRRDEDLGEYMKQWESKFAIKVDPSLPYLIRLDGHRFSKFTQGFKKPCDMRIFEAMHRTSADLINILNCVTAYTESDEITLVFPPIPVDNQEKTAAAFNGKVQKIATLASGYCSVRFAYHLSQQRFEDNEKRLVDKIHEAYFDARIFNLANTEDIYKNIYWRQNDCQCNSILNLGYAHLRQADMEGLGPNKVKKKLLKDKGIDYNNMPDTYRLGMFIKKKLR